MDYRIERDSMGEMEVPADRYWGAQTQRSYQNFQIGTEKMPEEIVRAFGILKKAAALANHRLGKLDDERLGLISRACDEVVAGKLDGHFPLVVWQTGSGTQSNMNANEVIANRALEIMGHQYGEYQYCSPNDDVNCAQSTNDAYPTAIHLGMYATHLKLVEHLKQLIESFEKEGCGVRRCPQDGPHAPAGCCSYHARPGDGHVRIGCTPRHPSHRPCYR